MNLNLGQTYLLIMLYLSVKFHQRARVDKRVFWPQYFRKIEYVCQLGFILNVITCF